MTLKCKQAYISASIQDINAFNRFIMNEISMTLFKTFWRLSKAYASNFQESIKGCFILISDTILIIRCIKRKQYFNVVERAN